MKRLFSISVSLILVVAMLVSTSTALSSISTSETELSPEEEPYILDFEIVQVKLYKDAELENPYMMNEEISEGTTVYYEIWCNEGVVLNSVTVNAVADAVSFEMPKELDIKTAAQLRGDSDGDNKLTVVDATNILKYIAGWKDIVQFPTMPSISLDTDLDSQVSISDVLVVLRAVAGWNGVLKPAGRATDFTVNSQIRNSDVKIYTLMYDNPNRPGVDYTFDMDSRLSDDIYAYTVYERNMFARFAVNCFNDYCNLYPTDDGITMAEEAVSYLSLLETYSNEFFEKNDLYVMYRVAENFDFACDSNSFTTSLTYQDLTYNEGGQIHVNYDITEREEPVENRWVLTLITVPKYGAEGDSYNRDLFVNG